jgi:WD40 repeat protein
MFLDSRSSPHTLKLQHDQLVELTGIFEPPDDELSALEDTRIPGSCEWLIKKEIYKSWQGAQSGSRPFFWLSGHAGFGKSVLCSRIINDLQQKYLECSYFFFKYGNSDKSTIVGCLRALAYQMAKADNSVLRRLLEVQHSSPPWEKWDEKTIWRKLFLGCIFKDTDLKTQFWVIDAVDECQKCPTFLSLLSTAPPCLRILFTSRNNPDIERSLDTIAEIVEHYQLQEEDTISDFRNFIESRMGHVPTGYGEGREMLRQKILEKASGSFLWVSLVIRRLEETYSEEEAEEVLSEVPTDMNELYAKMLESVLRNQRAVILAKSVYMWTSLSLRPLKIDGLQFALKMDTHQTVHNLERFIPSISGQLVSVNQKHEAEVIHQTAKAYLLGQESYPDLALDKLQCHTRIAQICLIVLTGNFTQGQQTQVLRRPTVSSSAPIPEFADYACEYFSDHLQKSSSEDDQNWDLLCKFLDCKVLIWIEYLAKKRKLRSVTRTAKNLKAYLRRRVKYLSPISPQKPSMEFWISDLLRLTAKFGANLNISPSSIQELIPAMCPSESLIFKSYASRSSQTGYSIKGATDKSWDDCLARVDYPAQQTSAIACGDKYSAVALSNGIIYLYFQESAQAKLSLNHGGRASILAFSNQDRYLASSGQRKVRVWDPAEGIQLWVFDTSHQNLTLIFVEEESIMIAVTQGNYTIHWDIREGRETGRWQWTDSLQRTTNERKSWQQPNRALFSPNHATLAVSYRGLPIYLFDIMTQKFIGCCSRETNAVPTSATNHYVVDAMAFNPSPEINILVASYGDGELAVYDLQSTQLRYRSPNVFAHCLKCSPDGRTLVIGSSRGTLQIFKFAGASGERLLPLYRINAYEDGIRDIAFTGDSLRFADIRGSEYRIWEPVVLVCNDLDEGSQSELSHAVTLEMTSVGMLEGPPDPEITAMCCPSRGNFVFCGKKDGSVSYFEISTACQKGTLYRHAANIGVTCIAYIAARSLLATADESGRVLINHIVVSKESCRFLTVVAEIRSKESLSALLPSTSCTKLLLRGKKSAEVWTTEGEKVGTTIVFSDDDEMTFTNHPLYPDHFVSITRSDMRIFSWTDVIEAEPSLTDRKTVNLTVTPPTPTYKPNLYAEDISSSYAEQWLPPFLAFLFKHNHASTSAKRATLRIWPASSITASNPSPPSIPLLSFANHSHRIRQIIDVAGSVVFFLDLDLWICSLDISTASPISKGARRHFFLLSEWQSINGGFIIEYAPATCEFLVARKHEVLVITRGLKFEEPWMSKSDTC